MPTINIDGKNYEFDALTDKARVQEKPVPTINIDGKNYEFDALTDKARVQVNNLRVTEAEMQRLKALLAIVQTAKISYLNALKAEIAASGHQAVSVQ